MPRAGWVKPTSDRRLSDLVAVGLLTRVFPAAGRRRGHRGRRSHRAAEPGAAAPGWSPTSPSPWRCTPDGSYEDVLAQLTDGLSWSSGWSESWAPPSKSAIFQARLRLGAEPLAALFARVARPLGYPGGPGGLRGWPPAGGHRRHLPGRGRHRGERHPLRPARGEQGRAGRLPDGPGGGRGRVLDARRLRRRDRPLLDSRGHLGHRAVRSPDPGHAGHRRPGLLRLPPVPSGRRDRADLLWRVRARSRSPASVETLADGSWLGGITPSGGGDRKATPVHRPGRRPTTGHRPTGQRDEHYRLFTTLLDPEEAPAATLAAAYAERWEIESTFDELKTHQRAPGRCSVPSPPELVRQEVWGRLCCHYPVRTLVWEAAAPPARTPTGCPSSLPCASLDVRSPNGALFPPDDHEATDRTWRAAIVQLLRRLNPARRRRSNPHVIKRKMPRWHVKRARHRHWPQPTGPPLVRVLAPN